MDGSKPHFVGIDLFAGAGGMSQGAQMAGIDVALAVEIDKHAAATYARNHPTTQLIVSSVENVRRIDIPRNGKKTVLFGGPPCQGFSTSNQRTRNRQNPSNWLFKEFVRIARLWEPDWIIFENVRGIIETEGGLFRDSVIQDLCELNYTCSCGALCACDFGVPQMRSRFFLIASHHGVTAKMPTRLTQPPITVREAIADLPSLPNGADIDYRPYPGLPESGYALSMRNGHPGCSGHLVTKNADHIVERYKHIPQGGNWESIPDAMMVNYADRTRCHTGIYRRLREDEPSVVLGNYRKNMLVHPWEHRGLSVREAARLQSFPDWYKFQGTIGFQQQQVGNAVPPLLAKAVFLALLRSEGHR
jgi:DNA (cytosine-5)-methyltransferase 1